MAAEQHNRPASDVRAEASAWIAQIESGHLSPADVEALREWVQRSPRHAAEIRRLARLSADLNVLGDFAEPLRAAAGDYGSILRRGRSRSGWWLGAIAAGLLAFVLLLPLLRPAPEVVYATTVGGWREQALPDGSVVMLNTNTRLGVRMGRHERSIRLEQGEAYFRVAHDESRPFVVSAGQVLVRAVGTAFGVRLDAADVQVAVEEGRVRLAEQPVPFGTSGSPTRDAKPPEAPVLLGAGQVFTLQAAAHASRVATVSGDEMRRHLAWRRQQLDFSDARLEDVIREVNRYTTLRINIADPELRQLRFGGIFPATDPEILLDALQSAYGVEVVRVNPQSVVLIRRHAPRG